MDELCAQTNDVFPPAAQKRQYEITKLSAEIILDGELTEEVWQKIQDAGNFYQIDPQQGKAPSFQTSVKIFYDDAAVYIGVVCYDSLGEKGVRTQGLRRDFEFFETDFFGINFDTFLDEKTSLSFQLNPYGALRDIQVFEDLMFERNWNAVWDARTTITDSGWVAEIIIPWKSLRYPEGKTTWGVNFARSIRRLNEYTAWSLYPRAFSGYRMDYAGVLTGIIAPPAPLNLDIQPYISATDDSYESVKGYKTQAGLDVKWAVNPFSVLDFTYNTDFAQAEVDNQVVNLTRFSLFFPEKRGFFLENERLFTSGWANSFYPFFSRRIGLDARGNPVPVEGGMRFVSKSTERNIGALYIRQGATGSEPAANFGVLRLKEFTGNRSTIGALLTLKNDEGVPAAPSGMTNMTLSADGFFRLGRTFSTEFTLSGSKTWHGKGDGYALYHYMNNSESWGSVGIINSVISANYNASSGYLIRNNVIQTYPYAVLNLRPSWKPKYIRSFEPGAFSFLYYEANTGRFQEGYISLLPLMVRMNDNSVFETYLQWNRQNPMAAFTLSNILIDKGDYTYNRFLVRYTTDQSYYVGGSASLEAGEFYNGNLKRYAAQFRFNPVPHAVLAASWMLYEIRDLGILQEDKNVVIFAPELRISLNPRVHFNLFYQYNGLTETAAFNVRASFEFMPLSYIYLVVNDVSSTLLPYSLSEQKQIVLKINYLFRN